MFYSDKPIFTNKEDLFHRSEFAKLLAQSFNGFKIEDTFTVGLFGKWGSGKTSLVNMMLEELNNCQKNVKDEDKITTVHFNPWNFSNTDQLLTQFFIHLSNIFKSKTGKKMKEIGKALVKYTNAFKVIDFIPGFREALSHMNDLGNALQNKLDEKDILKQKENVVNLLKQQKSRILIIIDDIDRLSNEQIRQIFQLITSVANFPNTMYLLAFDKEIVVKALKKVQEGSGEDYLEKIIQIPIQIPDIHKVELRKILIDRLNKIIDNDEKIHLSTHSGQKIHLNYIEPFIQNLRDINRLCNLVKFKLTTIASEVCFADMVAISAVEIRFPAIYEWIKTNKDLLTGNDLRSTMMKISSEEMYKICKNEISSVLKSEESGEANIIIEFLSNLFPYFGCNIGKVSNFCDWKNLLKNNHIAHPEKFDRYFQLSLDYVSIKKQDVLSAVYKLNHADLKSLLLEKDKYNNSYELLEEIKAMISEISGDRAKIIAEVLHANSNKLDSSSHRGFLYMSSEEYAEDLILDLIYKIEPDERLY